MMGGYVKPSAFWDADIYTIEPGVGECAKYLAPSVCGGIGGLPPVGARCHEYNHFLPSLHSCGILSPNEALFNPYLNGFLSMMDYVDEDVRFYCITSRDKVHDYIRNYLGFFLTSAQVAEIRQTISSYVGKHSHLESGYRQNIVVGTPYFNDLFYSTSWRVAQYLFSASAIASLEDSFIKARIKDRSYNPYFPLHKFFVNNFDGGETLRFFFDAPNDLCWIDSAGYGDLHFHCSESDYKKSLRQYFLFLSNWTLILACCLSMHAFGQCAFGLYWETGAMSLQQKRQRENWWSSRNCGV